jgi:iron complex outermembrane recepter protein
MARPTAFSSISLAEYNDDRAGRNFPLEPLFNGAFVPIPRSRNHGESPSTLQTTLFFALTWSHQFNNNWSIKQQIAYNQSNDNQPNTAPVFVDPVSGQVQLIPLAFRLGQTTYSTNVDITGHINTFGAEHTLLLGGDVYRLIGGTFSNAFSGRRHKLIFSIPSHPARHHLPLPVLSGCNFLHARHRRPRSARPGQAAL